MKPQQRKPSAPRELGDDPYAEGHDAAEAGLPETSNPYTANVRAAALWLEGYRSLNEE